MGVPSFYWWLCKKCPAVAFEAVEIESEQMQDEGYPTGNPIVDNLYLDMNGIIHPCCRPEGRENEVLTEEEMIQAVFLYIDRIIRIVRPRKLLYMAIDGVAPRAKMNQQRSRRFRAAQDRLEEEAITNVLRARYQAERKHLPPTKAAAWDSNVITPGTPFMAKLANALRFYIVERLNSKWPKDLKVIFSDAQAPGEGEHKIMAFIRTQRSQNEYDPNITHCVYGMDADLIMLALSAHEPSFYIIREAVKLKCTACGQDGHSRANCRGLAPETRKEAATKNTPYQYVSVPVLREWLDTQLRPSAISLLPYGSEPWWNLERAIDDWIFMCFFVGNDFLPHPPAFDIRDNAIDAFVDVYKKMQEEAREKEKSFLITKKGQVDLEVVHRFSILIGRLEESILSRRVGKGHLGSHGNNRSNSFSGRNNYSNNGYNNNNNNNNNNNLKRNNSRDAGNYRSSNNTGTSSSGIGRNISQGALNAIPPPPPPNLLRPPAVPNIGGIPPPPPPNLAGQLPLPSAVQASQAQPPPEVAAKIMTADNSTGQMNKAAALSLKDKLRKRVKEEVVSSGPANNGSDTMVHIEPTPVVKTMILKTEGEVREIAPSVQKKRKSHDEEDVKASEALTNDDINVTDMLKPSTDESKPLGDLKSSEIDGEQGRVDSDDGSEEEADEGILAKGAAIAASLSSIKAESKHAPATENNDDNTSKEARPQVHGLIMKPEVHDDPDPMRSVGEFNNLMKLCKELSKRPLQSVDAICLGTEGYAKRYYKEKFLWDTDFDLDRQAQRELLKEYVRGLCWVFEYYYVGCPSWEWYFPYHYAPLVQDVKDVFVDLTVAFDANGKSEPFLPFQQLLGVFPAASAHALPPPLAKTMLDPNSSLADFYPKTFRLDPNGQVQAWKAVALLPFIDAKRLVKVSKRFDSLLTEEERGRNSVGCEYIYFNRANIELANTHTALECRLAKQETDVLPTTRSQELKLATDSPLRAHLVNEKPTIFGTLSPMFGAPAFVTVKNPVSPKDSLENKCALAAVFTNPQPKKHLSVLHANLDMQFVEQAHQSARPETAASRNASEYSGNDGDRAAQLYRRAQEEQMIRGGQRRNAYGENFSGHDSNRNTRPGRNDAHFSRHGVNEGSSGQYARYTSGRDAPPPTYRQYPPVHQQYYPPPPASQHQGAYGQSSGPSRQGLPQGRVEYSEAFRGHSFTHPAAAQGFSQSTNLQPGNHRTEAQHQHQYQQQQQYHQQQQSGIPIPRLPPPPGGQSSRATSAVRFGNSFDSLQ